MFDLKMLCLYLLGQNCLHFTLKPYLSSETYSRKYEKLPNIVVHACTILQKNVFVENVWPANVETVKWLDYNQYSQLTRWCSGNASALGARCPGFNHCLRQCFLCLILVLLLLCFYFFVQKHTF